MKFAFCSLTSSTDLHHANPHDLCGQIKWALGRFGDPQGGRGFLAWDMYERWRFGEREKEFPPHYITTHMLRLLPKDLARLLNTLFSLMSSAVTYTLFVTLSLFFISELMMFSTEWKMGALLESSQASLVRSSLVCRTTGRSSSLTLLSTATRTRPNISCWLLFVIKQARTQQVKHLARPLRDCEHSSRAIHDVFLLISVSHLQALIPKRLCE